jgi:uncharacterized protein YdcH (DUF465 family)
MAQAQLPTDDVKTVLLQTDDGFRQLVMEHLDERIRELSTLSFLSDAQQYEEHHLKKQKLAVKDRIEAAVRARCATGSS